MKLVLYWSSRFLNHVKPLPKGTLIHVHQEEDLESKWKSTLQLIKLQSETWKLAKCANHASSAN